MQAGGRVIVGTAEGRRVMAMTYVPRTADIGLVPIRGQLGMGIRIGQWLVAKLDDDRKLREYSVDEDWADYQHAFVYLGDGTVIEAEPGGARIRPLSEYSAGEIYWCSAFSATDAQRTQIAQVARSFKGVDYSFLDYAAIAAHSLHIPAPGLRHYIGSTKHLICSQLAVRAWDLGGVRLFPHRWAGYVDPLDLFLLDQSLKGKLAQSFS